MMPGFSRLVRVLGLFFLFISCSKPAVILSPPPTAPDSTLSEARQKMSKGDFEGGLAIIKEALAAAPADRMAHQAFLESLQKARNFADSAFERGEFDRAGDAYFIVLKYYPAPPEKSPGFSRRDLEGRLSECSLRLTDRGLALYRGGEIEKAVSVWRGVLRFDPENGSVKKAIETARTQLKNLDRLE